MAKVTVQGLAALVEELKKFPEALQARATQTGVRKAAGKLRTALRRGAYAKMLTRNRKRTNRLRSGIRSAVGKKPAFKGKAWVALKASAGEPRPRYYYKTLEQGRKPYQRKAMVGGKRRRVGGKYAGSPPMKPFWSRTVRQTGPMVQSILMDETRKAIAYEAGKAYARSKGRR